MNDSLAEKINLSRSGGVYKVLKQMQEDGFPIFYNKQRKLFTTWRREK
jgi:biotin operon repressor